MEAKVPIWVWKNRIKAGGFRRKPHKEVKWGAPAHPTVPQRLLPPSSLRPTQVIGFVPNQVTDLVGERRLTKKERKNRWRSVDTIAASGNLESAEYQFFVGSRDAGSEFCKCRGCLTTLYSKLSRKAHLKISSMIPGSPGCAHKIIVIGKLLAMQDVCVSCDRKGVVNRKWGIPVCNTKTCLERFMFDLGETPAWLCGRSAAQRQGYVAPAGKGK